MISDLFIWISLFNMEIEKKYEKISNENKENILSLEKEKIEEYSIIINDLLVLIDEELDIEK